MGFVEISTHENYNNKVSFVMLSIDVCSNEFNIVAWKEIRWYDNQAYGQIEKQWNKTTSDI